MGTFLLDYKILHVHILNANLLKSMRSLTTNMIQDSAVNQHQHMVFIIISKQIKSLSTFCN